VYGWDEMLEGPLPEGTVIASWRGMTGAVTALNRGFEVVSCPDHTVYLDYRQSERPDEPIPVSIALTVEDTYAFEPVPEGVTPEQAALVLGGQANVWTEHIDSPRMIDFYVFPRLCAIAEALWTEASATSPSSATGWTSTWPGWTRSASSTGRRTGRCPGRPGPASRPSVHPGPARGAHRQDDGGYQS
jgi:hypothetical protein